MLSRIAESLFWIGRYVERAEDTARITDVTYHSTLGMGTSAEEEARRRRQWEALLAVVGDNHRFLSRQPVADDDTVPAYLMLDTTNPNSVISCVARARVQAGTMRHQIASEMWEALNRFHLRLQQVHDQTLGAGNAHEFFRSIVEFSHLFQGVTDSTMPREEGWYFLQAGKFLERAEKTARALDINVHLLLTGTLTHGQDDGQGVIVGDDPFSLEDIPADPHLWFALMRSLSAYEAYHKVYRSAVRPRSVIEMLVLSPVFPRSIRFAIREVESALASIAAFRVDGPGGIGDPVARRLLAGRHGEAERTTGRLRGQLAYGTVDEIFAVGLHRYLLDLERTCHTVGELIQEQYFSPKVLLPEEFIA
jgi:uncharacterized alpha-E superfamily protein